MTYKEQQRLRVVAFHEGDTWVAQCLEHDLACQAETLSDLLHRISIITDAYEMICRKEQIKPWEENILPAPQEYVDMWEKAVFLRVWEQRLPKPVIDIRVL
jgi:hypothetical protein